MWEKEKKKNIEISGGVFSNMQYIAKQRSVNLWSSCDRGIDLLTDQMAVIDCDLFN